MSVDRKGKMAERRMLVLPWRVVFQPQDIMSQRVVHEARTLHGFFERIDDARHAPCAFKHTAQMTRKLGKVGAGQSAFQLFGQDVSPGIGGKFCHEFTGEAQGADKGIVRTFAAKVEGGRVFLDAALLKRRSAA